MLCGALSEMFFQGLFFKKKNEFIIRSIKRFGTNVLHESHGAPLMINNGGSDGRAMLPLVRHGFSDGDAGGAAGGSEGADDADDGRQEYPEDEAGNRKAVIQVDR